jgi:hypothetical protein
VQVKFGWRAPGRLFDFISTIMQTGPIIRLAIDLHRIEKHFPLDYNVQGGFDYDMIIDRNRYNEVAALLSAYDVSEDQVILEVCFILIWIEKIIRTGAGKDQYSGEYNQMWLELDNLKDYLMQNRVTSISFRGEYERNQSGEEFILQEDINIDRLCDGIRSIFRDEFNSDKQKRRKKSLQTWKRRKMILVHNNILNYFTAIPELDILSLDDQNQFISKLSDLAGLPE